VVPISKIKAPAFLNFKLPVPIAASRAKPRGEKQQGQIPLAQRKVSFTDFATNAFGLQPLPKTPSHGSWASGAVGSGTSAKLTLPMRI
jgi:hypothetical protein